MSHEGLFADGEIEGYGKTTFTSGDSYTGYLSKSKFNGYGCYKHTDGLEVKINYFKF